MSGHFNSFRWGIWVQWMCGGRVCVCVWSMWYEMVGRTRIHDKSVMTNGPWHLIPWFFHCRLATASSEWDSFDLLECSSVHLSVSEISAAAPDLPRWVSHISIPSGRRCLSYLLMTALLPSFSFNFFPNNSDYCNILGILKLKTVPAPRLHVHKSIKSRREQGPLMTTLCLLHLSTLGLRLRLRPGRRLRTGQNLEANHQRKTMSKCFCHFKYPGSRQYPHVTLGNSPKFLRIGSCSIYVFNPTGVHRQTGYQTLMSSLTVKKGHRSLLVAGKCPCDKFFDVGFECFVMNVEGNVEMTINKKAELHPDNGPKCTLFGMIMV